MQKIKLHSIFLLLAFSTAIIYIGCGSKDDGIDDPPPTNECNGVSATFAANVMPIIQSRCAIPSCHAAGSSNGPGALTTYAQISAAKNAIIAAAVNSNAMPASGGPLTAAQKLTIKCWVNAGGLNN